MREKRFAAAAGGGGGGAVHTTGAATAGVEVTEVESRGGGEGLVEGEGQHRRREN